MLKQALHYISHWEDWHWFAKYIPIAPVWLWHCLRSGSLWFFTPSNPSLTFGGFLGETKREMYEQLPPSTYPFSIYISPSLSFIEVEDMFEATKLHYPVAVKPDAGMMGFMFRKMQSLANLDAVSYKYDNRVSSDSRSAYFSFSVKEEAFYIIGLHPQNNRASRRFKYPALVFNPHAQFEHLRESGKYESIKKAVRKRDIAYSGSVNPMLKNFGQVSEVFQYSGRNYDKDWECPLKITHSKNETGTSLPPTPRNG